MIVEESSHPDRGGMESGPVGWPVIGQCAQASILGHSVAGWQVSQSNPRGCKSLQPVARIIRLDRVLDRSRVTGVGMRGKALKAYWILAAIALVLCAASLPARADSVSYNYSYNLVSGGSSVGTVSGTFTFNSSTATFSAASITFTSSLFGNVTLTSVGSQTGFVFAYAGVVGGNLILYTITVNPFNPSQYWVSGSITNLGNGATAVLKKYTSVPEGGTAYGYLIPSLVAVCGAIALAGRRPKNVKLLQAG